MRLRDIPDWPPQWVGSGHEALTGEGGILLNAGEGLHDGELTLEVEYNGHGYTGVVTPGTQELVLTWCEILDNFREHELETLAGVDL